jgi:hypothetical protein
MQHATATILGVSMTLGSADICTGLEHAAPGETSASSSTGGTSGGSPSTGGASSSPASTSRSGASSGATETEDSK